jgi:hypothetical protein
VALCKAHNKLLVFSTHTKHACIRDSWWQTDRRQRKTPTDTAPPPADNRDHQHDPLDQVAPPRSPRLPTGSPNSGGDVGWERDSEQGPHETRSLTLDSAKTRSELGWIATIDVQRSIEMTVEWEKAVDDGEHTRTVTERQVDEYLRLQSE